MWFFSPIEFDKHKVNPFCGENSRGTWWKSGASKYNVRGCP
jgi:hypothetical protein